MKRAQNEYDRIDELYKASAASRTEWDKVQTDLQTTQAELQRAEQALREAEITLDYATIESPMDGTVVDKVVEVGDMVRPGQSLLTVYDPTRMQLVANVRESLAYSLSVGQVVGVKVAAMDHACEGKISEIVPKAEAASRSFSVKVTGPCPPGIYAGMFGRLIVPIGETEVLVIPSAAVKQIGQLSVVEIAADGMLQRRTVQLGRTIAGDVEILAGLAEGEQVAMLEASSKQEGPAS